MQINSRMIHCRSTEDLFFMFPRIFLYVHIAKLHNSANQYLIYISSVKFHCVLHFLNQHISRKSKRLILFVYSMGLYRIRNKKETRVCTSMTTMIVYIAIAKQFEITRKSALEKFYLNIIYQTCLNCCTKKKQNRIALFLLNQSYNKDNMRIFKHRGQGIYIVHGMTKALERLGISVALYA